MSVIRNYRSADEPIDGEKVELPRPTPAVLLKIEQRWAGENPKRWQALGALLLQKICGLTLDQAAMATGQHRAHRGTVLRRIARCRADLREVLPQQKEEE